jgi:hypothetical protein
MTPSDLARAMPQGGSASIPYADPCHPDRPLVLECHRPASHRPDSPVVIVQHGMSRNGGEYRDAWVPVSERHGLLIVAITFPAASWPNAEVFNNGNVLSQEGAVHPRAAWSYAIPGRVFALLRAAGITTQPCPHLWGHSAGGQFVHRLLAVQADATFGLMGAANPGWYTLPTLDRAFPEGLGGLDLTRADLERWLGLKLTVFAGDRDIETGAENLPRTPAALAQGPHRFARAHYFLEQGQAAAQALGVACNWRLVVVPGVGHEGARMSAFAGEYWFDR